MANQGKVQKKKKNAKFSPFWCFALEFKGRMKSKGITIHNDTQLKEMAAPNWEKMTDAEKNRYKEKAANAPAMSLTTRTTYNSLGQSIAEAEAERVRPIEEENLMREEIRDLLEEANNRGELDTLVFHFISASSFYKTSDDIFPAEIALAKFSLKEGVFDDIHIRINPGKLPLGSTLEAMEKLKNFHKYPLPPDCDGERDYMAVLEKIVGFFQPSQTIPILFADNLMKVSVDETRKIIKKIFRESMEDDTSVKVYSIIELFYALQRKAVANKNLLNETKEAPLPSLPNAELKFKDSTYANSPGCEFHIENNSVHNCCLTRVRCDGYTMSKWCSDGNRYELKEGKHFPDNFQKNLKIHKVEDWD